MKDNRERFIQDMLDTFDDTNAYQDVYKRQEN